MSASARAPFAALLAALQAAQPLDNLLGIETKPGGPIQVHYYRATITFSTVDQLDRFLNLNCSSRREEALIKPNK
jgi:hypothetical protein